MGRTLYLSDVQRGKSEKGDDYGASVVDLTVQECDLLGLIPWRTTGTLDIKRRRTNSVPTVGFRQGRGTSFGTVTTPTFDQVTDAVYALGAQIDLDKADVKDKNAPDILAEHTKHAVKGMTWKIMDYIVNGDHATDPHGFEGIKVRLTNSPASQVVYGVSSSAELDVRASASPSEATLYTFLDKIDEAIDAADGHTVDIALTSSDFIATLRSVLRRLGKYTERPVDAPNKEGDVGRRTSAVKPSRPALIYPEDKGIKWYSAGYKADQSTLIVGTETVNAVACRPVYFAKIGGDYLTGIQQYPMEIDGPKKLEDGVTYRVVIDWPMGLHHGHNKTFSKLAGVRVA